MLTDTRRAIPQERQSDVALERGRPRPGCHRPKRDLRQKAFFQHDMRARRKLRTVWSPDQPDQLSASGRAAIDLLWHGCGIELEPPSFPTGSCAATRLGNIGVVIHRTDDAPGFELYVGRSFARSLWLWLLEVGGGSLVGDQA